MAALRSSQIRSIQTVHQHLHLENAPMASVHLSCIVFSYHGLQMSLHVQCMLLGYVGRLQGVCECRIKLQQAGTLRWMPTLLRRRRRSGSRLRLSSESYPQHPPFQTSCLVSTSDLPSLASRPVLSACVLCIVLCSRRDGFLSNRISLQSNLECFRPRVSTCRTSSVICMLLNSLLLFYIVLHDTCSVAVARHTIFKHQKVPIITRYTCIS